MVQTFGISVTAPVFEQIQNYFLRKILALRYDPFPQDGILRNNTSQKFSIFLTE